MSLNLEFNKYLFNITKALNKLNKPKVLVTLSHNRTIDIYSSSLMKIKNTFEKSNLVTLKIKPLNIQLSTEDWQRYINQQPNINIEIEPLELEV